MMLDMMAPMNKQLNEMKLLHENTKACSGELEKKIDELKRVMGMQSGALQNGYPLQSMGQNVNQDNSMLDPSIL